MSALETRTAITAADGTVLHVAPAGASVALFAGLAVVAAPAGPPYWVKADGSTEDIVFDASAVVQALPPYSGSRMARQTAERLSATWGDVDAAAPEEPPK